MHITVRKSTASVAISAIAVIGLVLVPSTPAQQPTDAQEMHQQVLQGYQEQGQMAALGHGMALQNQPGTWIYPVRSGLHTQLLEDEKFPMSKGVDTDFVAKASVYLTQTVPGPDICHSGEMGVSDFRLIAMQPKTGSGSFDKARQESRLVVNQQQQRVVLYLHGEVREWKPGPEFCGGERQMIEANSGPGSLRLAYSTQGHFVPLHFMAYSDEDAIGDFSWDVKNLELFGHTPVAGVPLALATAPVQSNGSLAEGLALAQQFSDKEIPSAADIEATLPEGISLDSLPITMTGQAASGPQIGPNIREWFLYFNVDLLEEGKKIAKGWVDPWR